MQNFYSKSAAVSAFFFLILFSIPRTSKGIIEFRYKAEAQVLFPSLWFKWMFFFFPRQRSSLKMRLVFSPPLRMAKRGEREKCKHQQASKQARIAPRRNENKLCLSFHSPHALFILLLTWSQPSDDVSLFRHPLGKRINFPIATRSDASVLHWKSFQPSLHFMSSVPRYNDETNIFNVSSTLETATLDI